MFYLYKHQQPLYLFYYFDLILKEILEKDKRAQLIFIKDQWNSWNKILINRWKKSINKNLDRIKFVDRLSVDEFINLSDSTIDYLDNIAIKYYGHSIKN